MPDWFRGTDPVPLHALLEELNQAVEAVRRLADTGVTEIPVTAPGGEQYARLHDALRDFNAQMAVQVRDELPVVAAPPVGEHWRPPKVFAFREDLMRYLAAVPHLYTAVWRGPDGTYSLYIWRLSSSPPNLHYVPEFWDVEF